MPAIKCSVKRGVISLCLKATADSEPGKFTAPPGCQIQKCLSCVLGFCPKWSRGYYSKSIGDKTFLMYRTIPIAFGI